MKHSKIGWIGLGKMGIPMVQNLINATFPVIVYNRNKAKAAAFLAEGVEMAESPATLLDTTDVVILMIADDQAVKDVFNGEAGLFSSSASGKIIINMSTVSPAISKEIAALCVQKGNQYLDAPVSGSVKQATDGSLVIMAGGAQAAFESVKPIFDTLGKLALHIGENGIGNSAKLAINTLLGFHAQGLAEAVVFAQNQGVKTNDLMELINNSALGNVFMKIKGEAILNDQYQAAFALKHIAKDLRLAKAEGLNSPLADTLFNSFEQAETDLGEEDIIAIIKKVK